MAGKIKIRSISKWNIVTTVTLALLCVGLSILGFTQYRVLCSAMQDYISCEKVAHELQEGSDILTKQVRLAAATGESSYIDAYFEEANVNKTREKALEDLTALDRDTDAIKQLQEALDASVDLMQTEYYSMRLVEESIGSDPDTWPEELQNVELSQTDASLPATDKLSKAQQLVISLEYEKAKEVITSDINNAIDSLANLINSRQNHAEEIFTRLFIAIIVCVLFFAVMMLVVCQIMHYWIVSPLMTYNNDIKKDSRLSVGGAYELQALAKTYN